MSQLPGSLQHVFQWFLHYWAQLSGWQRRLFLVAVGMSAIALAWWFAPKPTQYATLYEAGSLNRAQLRRVDAALAQAKLTDYRINRGCVEIPVDRRAEYVAALASSEALPKAIGEERSDQLRAVNVFESSQQRKARLRDAHRREVEQVVRSLHGIDEAFLQFNEEAKSGLSRSTMVSALLALRMSGESQPNPQLLRSLRNIIASAHPSLAPSGVTVVDLGTGRTYAATETTLEATDEYLFAKQNFERIFTEKLRRHFQHIEGLRVTANVEVQKVSRDSQTAKPAHWAPLSVSASLSLPASYVNRMSDQQQELAQIERSAAAILPHRRGAEPISVVSVSSYSELPPSTVVSSSWVNALQTPLGIAVSLACVTFLFGMIWSAWPERQETPGRPASDNETPSATPTAGQPLRVHERLTELVRDNPKVAAETLTEWVRKAG